MVWLVCYSNGRCNLTYLLPGSTNLPWGPRKMRYKFERKYAVRRHSTNDISARLIRTQLQNIQFVKELDSCEPFCTPWCTVSAFLVTWFGKTVVNFTRRWNSLSGWTNFPHLLQFSRDGYNQQCIGGINRIHFATLSSVLSPTNGDLNM